MRRLTLLCLLLLTTVTVVRAQTTMSGPFYNLYGVGAPSGGCSNGYTYTNSSNGDFYSCNAGSWLKVSGGGGGSGTLTASGLSLPVNQIVLGNTYPDTKPLGSLGTTTTVLHGNAAGAPSFAGVSLVNDAAANQGTTTTVLHGNAAGQPSFGAVALASDVSGQLPISAVGSAGLSGTSPMAISAAGAISVNANGITASQLATQYAKLRCEPGLGDGLNAMAAGTYLESTCYNDSGVTWTVTGVKCFTDNSGTSTLNAAGNTLGALLTGAVTCTSAFAAGTQSANVALTSGDYIKFTFVADGTSKQTTWVVSFTQ